jgi:hypothetical protein
MTDHETFRDEYWAELLAQFDKLLALQSTATMDTERDRLIHAEALALCEHAVGHYRAIVDAKGPRRHPGG